MTVHKLTPPEKKGCRWCGEEHPDEQCPRLAALNYYKTGELMRVEFVGDPVLEFEFDDDPEAS